MGLPVICSRIRGNVDLIEDGKGGILCHTHSPEAFCAALKKMPEIDMDSMAEINRQKIKVYFIEPVKQEVHILLESISE